ncbi:MAG: shikimate kinase [Candidatus Margulisiibacteriota bacterium]
MNIILIGFMGVGKSEVGRGLAARLGMEFIDTDELIEGTEEKKIAEIFAEKGEEYFRDLETEIIKTLEDYDNFVISTGGGIVLREENVKMLKEIGPLVLLTSRPEAIFERLKDAKDRPLLEKGDKMENISQILGKRNPVYEKAADFKVDTSDIAPEKAVEEIAKWLT